MRSGVTLKGLHGAITTRRRAKRSGIVEDSRPRGGSRAGWPLRLRSRGRAAGRPGSRPGSCCRVRRESARRRLPRRQTGRPAGCRWATDSDGRCWWCSRKQQFGQRQLRAHAHVVGRQFGPDRVERLEPVEEHGILGGRDDAGQRLVEVVVGVDKAGQHDLARGVEDGFAPSSARRQIAVVPPIRLRYPRSAARRRRSRGAAHPWSPTSSHCESAWCCSGGAQNRSPSDLPASIFRLYRLLDCSPRSDCDAKPNSRIASSRLCVLQMIACP